MQTAFVVNINTDETVDPATVAEDLLEELSDSGWDVISVNPWSSPGAAQQPTTLDDIARAVRAQSPPQI